MRGTAILVLVKEAAIKLGFLPAKKKRRDKGGKRKRNRSYPLDGRKGLAIST